MGRIYPTLYSTNLNNFAIYSLLKDYIMCIKKLLTAMALLLPLAAMAQHWTAPTSTAYPDETPVWVQLYINGEVATNTTVVELAAFIDNECRAYVTTPTPAGGGYWYQIRVRGTKNTAGDYNKDIVFRAFYDGVEYEFNTKVPFTGETYEPTPLVLNLDAVTGISLPATIEVQDYLANFPDTLVDLNKNILFEYAPQAGTYTPLNESKVVSEFSYVWNSKEPLVTVHEDSLIISQEFAQSSSNFTLTVDWFKDGMAAGPSGSAQTEVQVTILQVPVTNVSCDITDTIVYAFEDFTTSLDQHIKIEPTDASIKSYQLTGAGEALVGGQFQAGGLYTITIDPDDPAFTGTKPQVNVSVYVRPSNIAAKKADIDVNYGDNVFEAIAANQTLTWPTASDPGTYGKSAVGYTYGAEGYVDSEGKACKLGSVVVTVTLVDGITTLPTFVGQASYNVTVHINSQLTVTAEPTTDLYYVKNGTEVSTTSPAKVYVLNPGNEPFNPDDLKITFQSRYSTTASEFPYAVQSSLVTEGNDPIKGDIYSFRIQPLYVGSPTFNVTYQGLNLTNGSITIDKQETFSAGWTWLSLATDGGSVSKLFTKEDLVEIRSQEELLWNDPTYGYIGALTDLSGDFGMYKVKTNKATSIYWNGNAIMASLPSETYNKAIVQGYNWVNYPYEFSLELSRIPEIFGADDNPADGDRIITQTGFIVYSTADNGWTGDTSFELNEGEGFMYYRNSTEGITMKFPAALIPTASNPTSGVKRFVPQNAADDVLRYDVHAFADNMSMIAEVKGLENPEEYTLGAFVNDECRGRGRVAVNGKMFVSAVGKSGEYMSFKLVNNNTGKVLPVDGVVSFSQIQGSLHAPVKLTMPIATGINQTGESLQPTESYDLSGRQIQGSQRGISIQRMSDGSVRKVVKK